MRKRMFMCANVVLSVVIASCALDTRTGWSPNLPGEPMYQSGRRSFCKAPQVSGDSVSTSLKDLGQHTRLSGSEHAWEYRFDAGNLKGGVISLCSEFGRIRIQGIDGTEGRLSLTLSDPFPGGDAAIRDTRLNTSVRGDTSGLRVGMWQKTQGMTTFREMREAGARQTAVNVLLELPRSGVYWLNLEANHQRVTVKDVDVRGHIGGYLSPGADLDVGLAGPLMLDLDNGGLTPTWRREAGFDFEGGTTARLRPIESASFQSRLLYGSVALIFVGADVGLDVIATTRPGGAALLEIGPTEAHGVDTSGTFARSLGYAGAVRKVVVRANAGDAVTVRRDTAPVEQRSSVRPRAGDGGSRDGRK